MDDERDAFIRAIEDHPLDSTFRFAYADWLEEHNDWEEAARQRVLGIWPDAPTTSIHWNQEAKIPRLWVSEYLPGWLTHLPKIWFPFELSLNSSFEWEEGRDALLSSNPKMIGLTLHDPMSNAWIDRVIQCPQLEFLAMKCQTYLPQRTEFLRLTALTHLRHLIVSNLRKEESEDFELLGFFEELESLQFRHCDFLTANSLKGLEKLSHFYFLHVEKCPKFCTQGLNFLSELTRVSKLSFSDNTLPGELFHTISKLTQLEELDFSSCPGITDNEIRHLTPLQNLRKFAGPVGNTRALFWLGQLSKLRYLDIHSSSITDQGFSHLAELKDLEVLIVSQNQITDEGLRTLQDFEKLEVLNLSHSPNVKGTGLSHLQNCRSLQELFLYQCSLTDEGMEQLPFLSCLEILTISQQRSQLTDRTLKHISSCVPRLRVLRTKRIGNNLAFYPWDRHSDPFQGVTDEGVESLTKLTQLTVLDLCATQIYDESIKWIAKIPSIQDLDLSNSGYLLGTDLDSLTRLPRLKSLKLRDCSSLKEDSLKSLAKCETLLDLTLPRLPGIVPVMNYLKEAIPRCNIQIG